MHPAIEIRSEGVRGCGWRKTGGHYLIGGLPDSLCGRLPIPLTVCPCCGHGIKPARGWTWVQADRLLEDAPECKTASTAYCKDLCPFSGERALGEAGLLWIGTRYYPLPADFAGEARRMGISRRIPAIPRGFEVGKTWVLLGHRNAIAEHLSFGSEPRFSPGVIGIFRPKAIEVVVDGGEMDEQIEAYIARGLTPVKIERIRERQSRLEVA